MTARDNLFKTASLKLSVVYLCIIMAISLIFSISLYQVSAHEVERGIRRPAMPFGSRIMSEETQQILENYIIEQEEAVEAAKIRIKTNLFIINIFILVSGGFLSYYFARKSLRPIEEAHAAQSRFTADASHELRTPIAAMRIENELALTDPKLDIKEAKKQLQSNIEELDKLTSLSERLLQMARMENKDGKITTLEVEHLLKKAIVRIKPIATKKKIKLAVGKIPTAKVDVDETRILEAFITILDNAVKYSHETSQIYIDSRVKNNRSYTDIRDEGIGIDKKHLPHIFERFYRADDSRTKSSENGYGIGLAIAKETIEAHGGNISVQSKNGSGSTFTISLPLN